MIYKFYVTYCDGARNELLDQLRRGWEIIDSSYAGDGKVQYVLQMKE